MHTCSNRLHNEQPKHEIYEKTTIETEIIPQRSCLRDLQHQNDSKNQLIDLLLCTGIIVMFETWHSYHV